MRQLIARELAEGIALRQQLMADQVDTIAAAARALIDCLRRGGKVLWCGNGGSAADCQHLSAELIGRLSGRSRPSIPSIALTTDTSALTAIANDYGYEFSFGRQVEGLGTRGDALVAISTSGTSSNVVQAALMARRREMCVVALVGGADSPLAELADVIIAVPSTHTPRIQEIHTAIGHIICGLIEDALFPPGE